MPTQIKTLIAYKDELFALYDSNVFGRAGYTLKEWNASDGKTYLPNQLVSLNSDLTLSAKWIKTTDLYSITYNMNGHGYLPSAAKTMYDITDLPYTPPNALDADDYKFIGWTPTSIAVGETGNKSFTANWEKIDVSKCLATRPDLTTVLDIGNGNTLKTI